MVAFSKYPIRNKTNAEESHGYGNIMCIERKHATETMIMGCMPTRENERNTNNEADGQHQA